MAIIYKLSINGGPVVTFASLGLSRPRISVGNFVSDTMEIDHPSAAWDGPALFAYRDDVTVWQVSDGAAVRVFRGKRVLAPRFCGALAERISYTFDGPFGWLMQRDLLQNAAVPPSEGEGPPNLVAQGLVILGQDDSGATVDIAQSIETFVNAAIGAGVPVTLGVITGLNVSAGWDWMRDIKIGEAIMRVLQSVPDAFCAVDYSTANPTLNFIRAASLEVATLPLAPAGTPAAQFGGVGGYAEFETINLVDRPDMVVPGVWVSFRSIDTNNGAPKLRVVTIAETALGAQRTDENALNRTVELAGAVSVQNTVSQDCKAATIPLALAGPGNTDPLTPGADFNAVLDFLARSEGWLRDPAVTVTKLTPSGAHSSNSYVRRGLEPDPITSDLVEVEPDTSLVRELVVGGLTSWMEDSGLNRKGQIQEVGYRVEFTRDVAGTAKPYSSIVTRRFMATNVSTRTYEFTEAENTTPGEPTPEGLVPVLYASLATKKWEGSFTLVQRECTMSLRPGMAVNITGGLAEWATMAAWVQSATFELESGRTGITLGFAKALGISDLIGSWRSNRQRQPAERGLMRATGRF